MKISRPTKLIVSGLIFLLLLAVALPDFPRAHVGQMVATWDAVSYASFAFLFAPLLCIWFGAGRSKYVEVFGWILLLWLTFGGLVQ